MRTFLLFISLFILTLKSAAQVIEVQCNDYIAFSNSVWSPDFFAMYVEDSIAVKEIANGENKYVINLKNRTVAFYMFGKLQKIRDILQIKKKDGIILLTIEDVDVLSNECILVYFAVNRSYRENRYPYFTFYYESEGDTNGYIVFNE